MSEEDIIAELRSRLDDLEYVEIPVQLGMRFGPSGTEIFDRSAAACIRYMNDKQPDILTLEAAEVLLNSEAFRQLRVQVRLVPSPSQTNSQD